MLGLSPRSTIQTAIDAHIAERDAALAHPLPGEAASRALVVKDIRSPYNSLAIGLEDKDLEILSADIAGITTSIKAGRWTSTQVLCAYVRATRRAQIRTNCLTEVFIDKALQRAAELDAHFDKTGELVGPFHGVPISLKDTFHLRGVKSTLASRPGSQSRPSPPSRRSRLFARSLAPSTLSRPTFRRP